MAITSCGCQPTLRVRDEVAHPSYRNVYTRKWTLYSFNSFIEKPGLPVDESYMVIRSTLGVCLQANIISLYVALWESSG